MAALTAALGGTKAEDQRPDVGNHAYSLGRYPESTGRPVLMSGYLGFGYPAGLRVTSRDHL